MAERLPAEDDPIPEGVVSADFLRHKSILQPHYILYLRERSEYPLQAIVRREIELVMAWSVDWLGRSLQQLVALLSDLHAKGVELYLHRQGIDTTIPAGKAMFQMCGVFSEFERVMIRERVKASLERARAQGKTLGRP